MTGDLRVLPRINKAIIVQPRLRGLPYNTCVINFEGIFYMAREDALRDKILKLGSKKKLAPILKYLDNPSDDIRMAVAMALGMIPTYDSGMGLIELLRDPSPIVRATAINSASEIHAKNCEEYIRKLAFADPDPNAREVAKRAFEKLKDNVITY